MYRVRGRFIGYTSEPIHLVPTKYIYEISLCIVPLLQTKDVLLCMRIKKQTLHKPIA